ncbi:MAG: hypothetical protein JXB49_02785 [Bacteroidales bacterium]|nr:hypothetical protein [Bacteroidales bacterium]
MNTLQRQITEIIDSADEKIQIAVSWFTDETILRKLIEKASSLEIEILLSADEINLLRHNYFRELIDLGVTVKKVGSSSPLDGDFMHSKFVIVDNSYAIGGSYNFTTNARSNYETFKRWDRSELNGTINEYKEWISKAVHFFDGINDPESIVRKLKEKFVQEQKRNLNLLRDIRNFEFSEKEYIQKRESDLNKVAKTNLNTDQSFVKEKADKIRSVAESFSKQKTVITNAATVGSTGIGAVQPHKFHGGSALTQCRQRVKNHYALSSYQKYHIDKTYNCFKTRINDGVLVCTGEIQPDPLCNSYKIRIEYMAGNQPQVYIKSPELIESNQIHVYREGFLCLFDPSETRWKDNMKLSEYTIPWLVEWILYYELWQLTGKWEGPESSHTLPS